LLISFSKVNFFQKTSTPSFFYMYFFFNFFSFFLSYFSILKIFLTNNHTFFKKNNFNSNYLLIKNYKKKTLKLKQTLKLKTFFFLKNIKKPFFSSFKLIKDLNQNFKPSFFFKFLTSFKKNKIKFVGHTLFKNYHKFSYVNKLTSNEIFDTKRRIKFWKLKKLFFFFKLKMKKQKFSQYFTAKKFSLLFFISKNDRSLKNKWTYIKINNLTFNWNKNDKNFFTSPIKSLYLKKKFSNSLFRGFNKSSKKFQKKVRNKNINWTDKKFMFFNKLKTIFFLKKNKKLSLRFKNQKHINLFSKLRSNFFLKKNKNQNLKNNFFYAYKILALSKKGKRLYYLNFKLKKRRKKMIFPRLIRKKRFTLKKLFSVGFFYRCNFIKSFTFFFKNNLSLMKKKKSLLNWNVLKYLSKKIFSLKKKTKRSFLKEKLIFKKKKILANTTKLKKQNRFSFFHNKSSKLQFLSKRSYRKLWTNKYFLKKRKLKQFLYKTILKKSRIFKKYRGRRNKFFLTKFFYMYNQKISKILKLKNFKINFNLQKFKLHLTNRFSIFNFIKKLKSKKIQRPHNFLKSKIWFPFIHFSIGFLYLDVLNPLYSYKKNNSWFLKKLLYSFASKNDLQNFVLKKYLKNNYRSVNKKFRNYTFFPDCKPYAFLKSYSEIEKNTNSFWIENSHANTNPYLNYFNQIENTNLSFFKSNSLFTAQLSSIDWESVLGEPSHLKSLNSLEYGFSIKKTKFKPGYSSMWRNFRSTLKISLNLKFKYQHQLTKYLLKFNKIIRNKLYLLFEMQLDNILTLSKFFPDRNWSIFFIKEGLVFINGFKVCNIFEQLFKNDFVQLVVSLKYYIIYRWLLNWQVIKKNRFKNKVHKKLSFKNLTEDKQKSKKLPLWILKHKNIREDVTKYLEIDYFSLSFFILYEPLYLTDINPLSFLNVRFNVINLFNWKYIN